jgi:uncharacterized protein YcbK (DUF882 family)
MAWEHFTHDELRCRCGCGRVEMKDSYMRKLIKLRKAAGFAFPVTSGYRCPLHNDIVSTTGRDGPHTTGRAVDIGCYGEQAFWIVQHAAQFGFTGIGVKQRGNYAGRFVHIDDLTNTHNRPRPRVWSY